MYSSETSFSVEELLGMILNNSRTIAEKFAGTDHKCFCLWLNIIFGLLRPFFSQFKSVEMSMHYMNNVHNLCVFVMDCFNCVVLQINQSKTLL